MIPHKVEQGTMEWLKLRAGIPTASEFDNIMTPEFKARTGEMPQTYMALKLAEKWLGGPLILGGSKPMDQGKILEKEAIPTFEFEAGCDVDRIGFITTDDKRVGCSPDGLIGDNGGLEVKCPEPHTHVRYLLAGQLPKEYRAQVHGSLYVTGRPEWNFYSYRKGFPSLLVKVDRDEEIMQAIEGILVHFLEAFDAAFEKLVSANGGIRPNYGEPDWISKPITA